MYILTFKGKPQTVAAILKRQCSTLDLDKNETSLFICGPTIKAVRRAAYYWLGSDWSAQKLDGYNIRPVNMVARFAQGVKVGRAA